jgi:hypothetical protein
VHENVSWPYEFPILVYVVGEDNVYRMSQEERSVFWEVIISAILRKKVYMNMCPIPNCFRYLGRSILNFARNIFLPSLYEQSRQPTDASHRSTCFRHWRITAGGKENIAHQIQNTARQISETVRNRTHVHINFFS